MWSKRPITHAQVNEWFTLTCLESHSRTWIHTMEALFRLSLSIVSQSSVVDARIRQAERRMTGALQGMQEYQTVVDECEMKTRQILTVMREKQMLEEILIAETTKGNS